MDSWMKAKQGEPNMVPINEKHCNLRDLLSIQPVGLKWTYARMTCQYSGMEFEVEFTSCHAYSRAGFDYTTSFYCHRRTEGTQ